MLKINNPQTIPFDPETDIGYALDDNGTLWYFGDSTEQTFIIEDRGIFLNICLTVADYGPFTRFQGTAEIGND